MYLFEYEIDEIAREFSLINSLILDNNSSMFTFSYFNSNIAKMINLQKSAVVDYKNGYFFVSSPFSFPINFSKIKIRN